MRAARWCAAAAAPGHAVRPRRVDGAADGARSMRICQMIIHALLSDQLFMWSVTDDRTVPCRTAATPQTAAAQAAAAGGGAARLTDRALQALRQPALPMRQRPRAWAQVLLVGQPHRGVAAHGVRPPGRACRGQRVPGQLRSRARDPGRDLADQPRAVAPAAAAVRYSGEPA